MYSLWNKDEKIVKLLEEHYNLELKAANMYINIATLCKKKGYEYVASFFIDLSKDKHEAHLSRILEYFLSLDLELSINNQSIAETCKSENTISELVEKSINMELQIRSKISEICDLCLTIKDYETFERMQWFVKDALKDLQDVDDISTYVNSPDATLLSIETAVSKKLKHKEKKLY